jgi:D-alanyl-D-alanine carboxypeptidase/D-alanyl-D-alanine-endopeptidase (penicillin-binding protein 4)
MYSKMVILILSILLNVNSSSTQVNIQTLQNMAEAVENHPNLKYGQWSMYAQNITTGTVVVDINSDKSLSPASNLKLLTSAVALSRLGPDYVFNTYLEYSGMIDNNGVLNGNIFIRGEGDPTLGSDRIEGLLGLDSLNQAWILAIRNAGIKAINGDIIGDDSFLDDMPLADEWMWVDIGNYYAPLTSGLCINENLFYIYFKPSTQVQGSANVLRTEPDIPGLNFINNMKTGMRGSGDNGFVYGAPWQWTQQLEGTIPAGVNEFSIKASLPDPAKFAARYLKRKLHESGIIVSGEALSSREISIDKKKKYILHKSTSPPLKMIVYHLNKKSINLYAEQLLKILAKKVHGKSSFNNGIKVIVDWLNEKNINCEGIFLHDGSGLSRPNGVTTHFLVNLLRTMTKESCFSEFYDSFPIAGDPNDIGTMKGKCKGTLAAGNLRAKTGQHLRICAHSGYVYTKGGDLICFSIIANNYIGSYSKISKLHEQLMIQLAEIP